MSKCQPFELKFSEGTPHFERIGKKNAVSSSGFACAAVTALPLVP